MPLFLVIIVVGCIGGEPSETIEPTITDTPEKTAEPGQTETPQKAAQPEQTQPAVEEESEEPSKPTELPPLTLEEITSVPRLTFMLDEYFGTKTWTLGVYGDERTTNDGVGFLVLDYSSLLANTILPAHSFIRLDGELPPYTMDGAEILVYGEVKNFSDTYGTFTLHPTPLITVERYHVLTEDYGGKSMLFPSSIVQEGSLGFALNGEGSDSGGDRGTIICGTADDNNQKERYEEDIKAKYKKLRELGLSDDEIDVFYNNGEPIILDGKNIVDYPATKDKIEEVMGGYPDKMSPSSTLAVFVTDHGAGYNPAAGYTGGRSSESIGKTYPEKEIRIDCRKKAHRESQQWVNNKGEAWFVHLDKQTNRLQLYKRENGTWVLKGSDLNGDGRVEEYETGQDVDNDGDKDHMGWEMNNLGPWQYETNEWDTDGDGTNDTKVEWDGSKFVAYKKNNGGWDKIGEDTDGDGDIDKDDGGVDWNNDGDKDDEVGFHEGITLWGGEVLWDDEFADILKSIDEAGIHIFVEMMQCFSGGVAANIEEHVEGVYTATDEDSHSYAYPDSNKKEHDHFEKEFADKLNGLDKDSWDDAFEKAKKKDEDKWKEWKNNNPGKPRGYYDDHKNKHTKVTKTVYHSESIFFEDESGLLLAFDIPEELEGQVYRIEILFGLQQPQWDEGSVITRPSGFSAPEVLGGIGLERSNAFPSGFLSFWIDAPTGLPQMRIDLLDEHSTDLGYTIAERGGDWLIDCVSMLAISTAMEYREDPEARERILAISDGEYIAEMVDELNICIASTHPSVTETKRGCARRLKKYITSEEVSPERREWVAQIYWNTVKSMM